ncbi:polysaccharide lyase family 8 super-sandwich domain-containing protein [Paenibacillus sp. YN15]|uniref:polysaccharide lyase family 8 super-sandwich domain-containing protein n=1 Tax=Paenibacillus sp. YN15 TaxID=1742774 RepID=UPI000DCBBE73|nr:polysaccharide lyase family 8 super-sandwich domain-containing protein [Paenibacillus sp. YN15]RAU93301.1 hypothetical protein DQG13_25900 [Paenibacillus sp. YN15]
MDRNTVSFTVFLLIAAIVMNLFYFPAPKALANGADEYDALRSKMYDVLTGGAFDSADPDIAPKITSLSNNAQNFWDTMEKSAGRTYLWSDQSSPLGANMTSNHVSGSYSRLLSMATAYSTNGTTLYQNADLLADILSGMDWMYANRYNMSVPVRGYDNWYDWQIAAPLSINSITVLLYPHLSAQQISDWQEVIARQVLPFSAGNTGANRIWTCNIIITSGILTKDSARITFGVDGISPVLDYVTSGEGFYEDGSFLQHTALIPYNGGYGTSLIDNLTQVMYIVAGSTWDITDPDINNVYQWIYNMYEPLFYQNSMMDMVNGRNIARTGNDNRGITSMGALGSSLVRLAYAAPNPEDAARYKSMIKQWMSEATSLTPYASLGSIQLIAQTKAIVDDPAVAARGELVLNKQYPNMARAVHRRPGFAFGISMSSKRVGNYESLNGENLKGWHTGDGMTYLYNSDITQFEDAFWPTVDSHRLPGTTVIQNSEPAAQLKNGSNWAGGTEWGGLYGVTGMELRSPDASLAAYKSWFMFDDEIVNLGAGIQSSDSANPVETIVDNRKLNSSGDNALTVDGVEKSSALDWEESMSGIGWAHLAGNAAGADVGYYFPGGADIAGLRESRTANWNSINNYYNDSAVYPAYFEDHTRQYLSLRFDHGTAPSDAFYSYVLLPNKTALEVGSYAAAPDITILENSREAQAVRENNLKLTGINFWQDAVKTVDGVTSNKKASVMIRSGDNGVEVSVADPTMDNTGTIRLELEMDLGPLAYLDSGIVVSSAGGKTVLTVNVNGTGGKTLKARFNKPGTPSSGPAAPTGLTGRDNTPSSITLAWNAVAGATEYRLYRAEAVGGPFVSLTGLEPGETAFTDTGLQSGVNYFYKAAALNAAGISEDSAVLSAWTVTGPPSGIAVDNHSGTSITLSWPSVPGATGYLVYRSTAKSGPFTTLTANPVAGLSYTDSTALGGINYYYRVAAVNEGGVSEPSAAVTSLFEIPAYLIDENFDGMALGNLNGQNGWVGDNGGVAANLVAVQLKSGSTEDKSVKLTTQASGGKSEVYKLFSAPAGSIVTVEDTVIADDNYWKNALIVADSSLTSSNIAAHVVMENGKMWGYNGGTKTDILPSITARTPYRLKAVINTSTRKFDVYVNDELRASQWSYRYSGVTKADKFSVSNSGNLNSSMSFDDVKISYLPQAPGNVTANTLSSSSIALSWSAAPGAAEYRVYRSASPEAGYQLVSGAGLAGLSYTDTGLSGGKTYSYKVVAVHGQAVSPESAIASATTAAPATPLFEVPAYLINEDFNGMTLGSLNGQDGWVADNGGEAANLIAVQLKDGSSVDKSVKLTTKYNGGKSETYKIFNAPQGAILTAEVTAVADDTYWKNALVVADSSLASNSNAVHVVMEKGKIWGYNGGTKTDILASITSGTPYRLKAVINTSTKKFDVYVNDELLGSQWSYRYSGITKLDKFYVSNSGNANSSMSFDDVRISYMPQAPGNVTASALSASNVGLSWSAAPGAAEYRVYRSASPEAGYQLVSGAGLADPGFADANLSPGTTYYYKVAAVHQQAVSAASATVSAATYAAAAGEPPVLLADTTQNDTAHPIEITFADNADWRSAITAVQIGDETVSGSVYAVLPGVIRINPGVLAPGAHLITVKAAGYSDSFVVQTIAEPAAAVFALGEPQAAVNGLAATVTADILTTPSDAPPATGTIIFQLMDGMTPVQMVAIKGRLANGTEVTAQFNLPAARQYTVKVFLWDDLQNQVPLAAPKTVTVAAGQP